MVPLKTVEPVRLPSSLNARLLYGLNETAAVPLADSLARTDRAALAVVFLPDTGRMEAWARELALFGGSNRSDRRSPEILLLPEFPEGEGSEPQVFERHCDRISALTRMLDLTSAPPESESTAYLVTTPRGFFTPVPPPESLAQRELRLRSGQTFRFQELVDSLGSAMGYDHEALCEQPGQFAVRGGLVDVYPLNALEPCRIDFFGDEIEAIRAYDPTSQRSLHPVSELLIAAFTPPGAGETSRNLFSYLPRRVSWFFWEPSRLAENARSRFEVFERSRSTLPTFADLAADRTDAGDTWTGLVEFDQDDPLFACADRIELLGERLHAYRSVPAEGVLGADRVAAETAAREELLKQLSGWKNSGARVVVVCRNEEEQSRIRRVLEESSSGQDLHPEFRTGVLREGFHLEFDGLESVSKEIRAGGSPLVAVPASELFGGPGRAPAGLRRRRLPRRARVDQLLDFSDLAEGDYLVHLAHGICRFHGLTRIELRGKPEEVISLEFADNVTLHLPLYESHLLSRYVGLAKTPPKLARLGGTQWNKTRRVAEKATLDLAASLLGTQAQRDTGAGHGFAPDSEWQNHLEETFPFEETADQLRAVEETKVDMERERPMDRLICGDVGFGKTEVAVRATFKAVMDGKQVAVLVPTTVLAQQHFNTFRERMSGFPVTVEMISRFRNRPQQQEILRQTREGRIDVLIGTHRLLSKDLRFRDLGLLVIDEEHRFGVRHKERLKQLRENVDVLNMSATPIPRTLHLALMGARDLSLIETPPGDRLPIHTVVKSYSPESVRDAIRYEIERGGQVFYLHNRVQTIDAVALQLQELCPDLRIAVGHGQMTENALERIMTRFVAGEFDVLACTTIIESGLDIPNCNTIIIEGADRFGLSQLYQLRGRVGRFNRQAYCYLLLHRHARMLDQARKRLSALRQHNQLGAGFRIAMRDLELRGAGNLLGPQQSGHIAGVGFDLYCQLLRQSISRLKGEPVAHRIRATIRLDFVTVGEAEETGSRPGEYTGFSVMKETELAAHRIDRLQACIPFSYITETRLRIDFYRRLALADSANALDQIALELRDRFGEPPQAVEVLLQVTELRILAEQKRIQSVECESNRLKCMRASGKKDDFIKVGTRFPRLTAKEPILRLNEIKAFIQRQS